MTTRHVLFIAPSILPAFCLLASADCINPHIHPLSPLYPLNHEMPKFTFREPERTSSDEGESDSDDSWTPGPPDPNAPEQLRLKRQGNVWLITNSNTIPQMDHPGQMPYCVWYPGFATEDTYRALARQYPNLRYNVGRACAVGVIWTCIWSSASFQT
jgi:hypothetical protein